MSNELDGCFNETADKHKRVDKCWSDTNLNESVEKDEPFDRLKCRHCNGVSFEVLSTNRCETIAKCNNCNMYYKVHCG